MFWSSVRREKTREETFYVVSIGVSIHSESLLNVVNFMINCVINIISQHLLGKGSATFHKIPSFHLIFFYGITRNCAFPQNFRTSKLSGASLFYVVQCRGVFRTL